MNFRLSGNQVTARAEVPGLEVTKYILDDQGNQIALDAATYNVHPLKSIIHVYEKASPNYESDDVLRLNGGDATRATGQLPADGQYSDPTSNPEHANLYDGYSAITNYDFDVEVGLNGKGLDHNYHVAEGMYYIEEDKDSVAPKVIGADGTTYRYTQTHIETEYAWRDDEYVAKQWGGTYNEPVHVSPTYTDLDANAPAYRSIPEVLGNYKDKDGSWVQENGAPVRNTMLPFYGYNVYTPDVKLDVEKLWVNYNAPEGTEVTAELLYAKRKVKNADGTAVSPLSEWPSKDNYVEVAGATWDGTTTKIFEDSLVTQLTLKADADESKNWKGTFTNLPHRLTDPAGNVWEFDYLAKETAVTADGESLVGLFDTAEHKTEPTAEEAHLSDGKVTIVNAKDGLIFEKKWLRPDGTEYEPSTSGPEASAVITGELHRKRTVEGTETSTTERLVTVTIWAKDTFAQNPYNSGNPVKLWEGQVVEGSDLYFSVAANGSGNPSGGYSCNNGSVVDGPLDDRKPTIDYLKPMSSEQVGITKSNVNVFVLRGAVDNTVITAYFDPKQSGSSHVVNDVGFGYYIVEADTTPETTTTTTDPYDEDELVNITGRVTDGVVTLNKDNNWKFTLSAADMEPGWEYYIDTDTIQEAGINGSQFAFVPAGTATTDANGYVTYINTNTNTAKVGDLSLTKKVTGTGADPNKVFDFTITLTPPAGMTLADSYEATLTGDSSVTSASPNQSGQVTVQLKAGQTYTIKDLPVGTTYSITEADYAPAGYTATTTSGSLTGTITGGTSAVAVEVTNTYSAVDITVVKIDETTRNATQLKLKGAKFKLYKLNETDNEYAVYPDAASCEKETDDEGTLTFEKLPNGRYKLEEAHVPDGYIAQSDVVVYFKVSAGSTLTWTDEAGVTITDAVQNLVGHEPGSTTFTIGNTPGQELPNAGGPGTLLGTLVGVAMIVVAALVLAQRRRAQEA